MFHLVGNQSYQFLNSECTYVPMDGPTLSNNRGKGVGSHKDIAELKECTDLCDQNNKCQSVLYHAKNKVCTLKDLILTGSEEITKKNKNYYSVYKACKEGKVYLYIQKE